MKQPDLSVRELSVGYSGTPVLSEVTFSVPSGNTVAVLGPNGGGKTTLMRALIGTLPPLAGDYSTPHPIGYVPQTEHPRLDFPVSVLDVALMGAYGRTPWYRKISRADRQRATEALELVGLQEVTQKPYGRLSGGQRQRALLARTLVHDAPLLLLDEPFSGIDQAGSEQFVRLLGELAHNGKTILVSTHDIAQALSFDLVLCLNGRQVAFGKPQATLTEPVLHATYGSEIVILNDSIQAIAVQHHSH